MWAPLCRSGVLAQVVLVFADAACHQRPNVVVDRGAPDDAAALLDQIGADRVIVVGYSMGGPVGSRSPGGIQAG